MGSAGLQVRLESGKVHSHMLHCSASALRDAALEPAGVFLHEAPCRRPRAARARRRAPRAPPRRR
jgi:hypothetical protein